MRYVFSKSTVKTQVFATGFTKESRNSPIKLSLVLHYKYLKKKLLRLGIQILFYHLNKFIKTILIGHNEKLESIYKVPLQSSISDINHSWISSRSLFCNCVEKVHHETFFKIVRAVVDSITFTKNIEFINRKTNNKAECTLDFLKL